MSGENLITDEKIDSRRKVYTEVEKIPRSKFNHGSRKNRSQNERTLLADELSELAKTSHLSEERQVASNRKSEDDIKPYKCQNVGANSATSNARSSCSTSNPPLPENISKRMTDCQESHASFNPRIRDNTLDSSRPLLFSSSEVNSSSHLSTNHGANHPNVNRSRNEVVTQNSVDLNNLAKLRRKELYKAYLKPKFYGFNSVETECSSSVKKQWYSELALVLYKAHLEVPAPLPKDCTQEISQRERCRYHFSNSVLKESTDNDTSSVISSANNDEDWNKPGPSRLLEPSKHSLQEHSPDKRFKEGSEMAPVDNHCDQTDTPPSSKSHNKVLLFTGITNEVVCDICYKNKEHGPIFFCNGPCGQPFHFNCVENLKNLLIESQFEDVSGRQYLSLHPANGLVRDDNMLCHVCCQEKHVPCFICGSQDNTIKCGQCYKYYHIGCVSEWPQSQMSETEKEKQLMYCPQHSCHTCFSINPCAFSTRFNNDRLVRCVMCPTTYHYGNYCIPAGSKILNNDKIVCQKHFPPQKKGLNHVNASWCYQCSTDGALICCDLCPNSFHADCLKISQPEGGILCEDCVTGRYPLFGEIVWVKLGSYRWWPARILFPQEVPNNIISVMHSKGEFAVEFFATHDYCWVNRGRVFPFKDNDYCTSTSTSRPDEKFNKSVNEAKEWHAKWLDHRKEIKASLKCSVKPPKYKKIKYNQKTFESRKSGDPNSASPCNCTTNTTDPCGPDSNCLNRSLNVECDPKVCRAGENCCNQNFQKRNYHKVVPFQTESTGWGLKTLDHIKKGSFIIEFIGEILNNEEYQNRLHNMKKEGDKNFYFLTIDKDRILDAKFKGNEARFLNHSCNPNAEAQKWTVNGETRVGLFALENIKPGTELVFNYNSPPDDDTEVECKCGSENCTGIIGAKNNSKPASSKQSKDWNMQSPSRLPGPSKHCKNTQQRKVSDCRRPIFTCKFCQRDWSSYKSFEGCERRCLNQKLKFLDRRKPIFICKFCLRDWSTYHSFKSCVRRCSNLKMKCIRRSVFICRYCVRDWPSYKSFKGCERNCLSQIIKLQE